MSERVGPKRQAELDAQEAAAAKAAAEESRDAANKSRYSVYDALLDLSVEGENRPAVVELEKAWKVGNYLVATTPEDEEIFPPTVENIGLLVVQAEAYFAEQEEATTQPQESIAA